MPDWLIGVLSFGALLALGAIVAGVIVTSRRRRQWARLEEERHLRSRRKRLLSGLAALDLAMTRLTAAVFRGSDHSAQERATRRAKVAGAANRCGDEELRRLMEEVVAHCDALRAAEREAEVRDPLVRQLGDVQYEVYRRMEVLLDQAFD